MEYKQLAKTNHAIGQNCFHLIWTPKYRYPVFKYEFLRTQCKDALSQAAIKHEIILHEICVEKDHVHLFAELPTSMSLDYAFQLLKGGSSYILRKNNPWMRKYKSLWSIGKFFRSVGAVTDEAIKNYIADSHHLSNISKSQTRLIN